MIYDKLIIVLTVFSVTLLVFTNVWLFLSGSQNATNIELVKAQLVNAKSGIVNITTPDYTLVIIVSIASFSIGLAGGILIMNYFKDDL